MNFKRYQLGGIIIGGALHSEKNEIGDRGVPVIPINKYKKGGYNKYHKIAEIERGEILFNRETSIKIENLIDEYDSCGCKKKLVEIGKLVKQAILNLEDKQCEINNICELDSKLSKIK